MTYTSTTPQVGDMISLNAVGGMTTRALVCGSSQVEIIDETAKAFKLAAVIETGKEITCWMPKKALVNGKQRDGASWGNQRLISAQIASWFKGDDWTARFLTLAFTSTARTA